MRPSARTTVGDGVDSGHPFAWGFNPNTIEGFAGRVADGLGRPPLSLILFKYGAVQGTISPEALYLGDESITAWLVTKL
jgi:hypothetical protein